MDKESLKSLLDQGFSVEKIAKRFGKDASSVSYWMRKYGLEAVNREKHLPKGGIERQRLEHLVAEGKTIAEMAAELRLSKGTVRHWMGQYELRTRNSRGARPAEAARTARKAGLLTVVMSCRRHGKTHFILEGRGYYRCKRCRSEAVARRRRKMKEILVAEAGGRCMICGYHRFAGALEFHHLDPMAKRMPLSARGIAYALKTLRAEAKKCVLLCANCHAEIENGSCGLAVKVSTRLHESDATVCASTLQSEGSLHYNPG